MVKRNGFLVFSLLCAFALQACTQKQAKVNVIVNRTVHMAVWSNYITQELIDEFKKQSGIEVQLSHFSSNEELLAKLQAGASGYDVIVPSDYMVFVMSKLGLLQALDHQRIPNAKFIDSKYLKKDFDPANEFSYPFDFGTTGIAVNHKLFKGQIKGWKDLWSSAEAAGKFTMLEDVRETLGAALKSQGKSLNSVSEVEIKAAKDVLLKVKKNIRGFSSEPMAALVSGEVPIAHIYASDALQAKKKLGDSLEYLLPVEGATLWIDNLAIPKSSLKKNEAHELIDFLLRAESVKSTVMSVLVSPVQSRVLALLPEDLRNSPYLFLSDEVQGRLEMIHDLGDHMSLWDRVWTEVKAE